MSERDSRRPANTFDLTNFLPYLLNISGEVTSLEFEQSYRDRYGMLRTEWRVLFHLGRYGNMTAREICDRSRTHKTKVSRAVKALQHRRFLSRERSQDDRRFEVLCLTDEGRTAYRAICRIAGEYDRKISEAFTAEENEVLRNCLRKLANL